MDATSHPSGSDDTRQERTSASSRSPGRAHGSSPSLPLVSEDDGAVSGLVEPPRPGLPGAALWQDLCRGGQLQNPQSEGGPALAAAASPFSTVVSAHLLSPRQPH